MKNRFLSLAAAAALMLGTAFATSAQAESIDMASMTCNDIESEEDATYIIFWLDGYLSAETGDTTMSEEWIEELGNRIISACQSNPNQSLLDIVRED